jgi:hypothetical protein
MKLLFFLLISYLTSASPLDIEVTQKIIDEMHFLESQYPAIENKTQSTSYELEVGKILKKTNKLDLEEVFNRLTKKEKFNF